MQKSKNAFTMIELIFVIVIIGILAAVGIPKLSASRKDAKASVFATHLANCVEMASKGYYMNSIFDVNDSNCKEVTQTNNCYSIVADDSNGTLKITDISPANNECTASQLITHKNNLSSSLGMTHEF